MSLLGVTTCWVPEGVSSHRPSLSEPFRSFRGQNSSMVGGFCGGLHDEDMPGIASRRESAGSSMAVSRPGFPHRSVLAQLRHTAPHVTFATGRHTEWIAIAGGSG